MSRPAVDDPEWSARICSAIPLGRWGEAADVAGLACYLASDAASFITGALIPMDGGETAGLLQVRHAAM